MAKTLLGVLYGAVSASLVWNQILWPSEEAVIGLVFCFLGGLTYLIVCAVIES